MKKYFVVLGLFLWLISCSDDSNDDNGNVIMEIMDDDDPDTGGGIDPVEENPIISLVGTWELSEVIIDDTATDATLILADQIFTALFEQDCDLVSFTFNAAGNLLVANSLGSLEVDAGFLIDQMVDCPLNVENIPFVWGLSGDQLSLTGEDGSEQTITIAEGASEDMFLISGDGINSDIFVGNVDLLDGVDLSVLAQAQAVFARVAE